MLRSTNNFPLSPRITLLIFQSEGHSHREASWRNQTRTAAQEPTYPPSLLFHLNVGLGACLCHLGLEFRDTISKWEKCVCTQEPGKGHERGLCWTAREVGALHFVGVWVVTDR